MFAKKSFRGADSGACGSQGAAVLAVGSWESLRHAHFFLYRFHKARESFRLHGPRGCRCPNLECKVDCLSGCCKWDVLEVIALGRRASRAVAT